MKTMAMDEANPHSGDTHMTDSEILTGPRAGEKITGQALRQELKHHRLSASTHVQHPKKGEQIIAVNYVDPDAPYFLISAVGEEVGQWQAVQS